MHKYLRLTLYKDPSIAEHFGPTLVNIMYVTAFFEWSASPDKPLMTKVILSNGQQMHVKESVESIGRWMNQAEDSNKIIFGGEDEI